MDGPAAPRHDLGAGGGVPGWLWDVLVASIALALGGWLWIEGAHLDPTARDQVHDLSLAIRIREGRSLSDGNRHPLFPALLAPFAGRDPDFQTRALIVGIVVTVLAVFAVHRATAKVYGRALGVLTVVVLIVEFRLQGRRICPENLIAGWLAVSAACLSTGAGRTGAAGEEATAGRAGRWWTLAGGAALGLAWLTKGSATLSLAAAVGWLATTRGVTWRGRARKVGWLAAGFVLTAWPLMAWNVHEGRQPLYNVNSAHVMWEDAWDGDLDKRTTATLSTWWAAHTVMGGVRRLATGLVTQRGIEFVYVTFAVLGIEAWRRRRARRGVADDGGGEASTSAAEAARAAWGRLAVWSGAIWLLGFAWYAPIVSSRRLLFPVFPVLVPPVLAVVAGWGRGLAGGAWVSALRRRAPILARGGSAVLLVLAAVLFVRGGSPGSREPIAKVWLEAADAMRRYCPKGSRVLVRPSRDYPPDWLLEGWVEYVELPRGGAAAVQRLESVGFVLGRPVPALELADRLTARVRRPNVDSDSRVIWSDRRADSTSGSPRAALVATGTTDR